MELNSVIQQENNLTQSFKPEQARIYDTFDVDAHYNLVVNCPEQLQEVIGREAEGLGAFPEVARTAPDNYHMTVLIFPLASGDEEALAQVRVASTGVLSLSVKGFHIRPVGIFVNVYDSRGELARVRQQIAQITGVAFNLSDRLANVGWITIGRFIAPLSQDVVSWVQQRDGIEFGEIDCSMSLYQSNNRQRLGIKIW